MGLISLIRISLGYQRSMTAERRAAGVAQSACRLLKVIYTMPMPMSRSSFPGFVCVGATHVGCMDVTIYMMVVAVHTWYLGWKRVSIIIFSIIIMDVTCLS